MFEGFSNSSAMRVKLKNVYLNDFINLFVVNARVYSDRTMGIVIGICICGGCIVFCVILIVVLRNRYVVERMKPLITWTLIYHILYGLTETQWVCSESDNRVLGKTNAFPIPLKSMLTGLFSVCRL